MDLNDRSENNKLQSEDLLMTQYGNQNREFMPIAKL